MANCVVVEVRGSLEHPSSGDLAVKETKHDQGKFKIAYSYPIFGWANWANWANHDFFPQSFPHLPLASINPTTHPYLFFLVLFIQHWDDQPTGGSVAQGGYTRNRCISMVKTMVSGHKWVLKQTQELSPLVQEKGAFFPEWLNTCKHPHFGLGHLHFLTSIHNTIHQQKTTIFPTINHCKVYKSTLKFTIKPGLEPGLEHVRTITRSRPCCSSSQLSWLLGAPCRTCGTPQRTLRLAGGFQRSGAVPGIELPWLSLGLW